MRYAIVGDPVEHSRSPAIHNAAFESLGIRAEFDFWKVSRERFTDVERALRTRDVDGVSVTMPHKHNAFEATDTLSDTARRTGAVNTMVLRDGDLFGHNTDVTGVLHALEAIGNRQEDAMLILGTGGAAAAALVAVDGREISVSGRNATAARVLIDRVGVEADVIPWGSAVQSATVINATPLGMHGESLPIGVTERAGALIDMTYGGQRSPAFMDATAFGIPAADGLTMLVGQAVEAFEVFTGQQPPILVMEQAARS